MKKLMLAVLLLALPAFGAISDANKRILNQMMGEQGRRTLLGTLIDEGGTASLAKDGIAPSKVARATYDVAVDTGTIAAHALGVTLPAHAIVRQAWFQITTQFVDAGSGTVALSCASANDIFSAADITGSAAGTITAGVPTGVAATMFDVGATECELTATVATAAQTAGKLVLYVQYEVSDAS